MNSPRHESQPAALCPALPPRERTDRRGDAPRAGFTLIELLVVISVIGILLAICLPAVQQVRAAARLTQCKAHLQQLGLALHGFESSHQSLPAGCDFQSQRNHAWSTAILPYLDEAATYNQYNMQAKWNDPAGNAALTSRAIPVFVCPSATFSHPGECDYGGNYGSAQSGLSPGMLIGEAWESGALPGINLGRSGERKLPTKFREFTDGLSSTFLVLECVDRDVTSGSWGVGTNCLAIEFPVNQPEAGRHGETIISHHHQGGQALYADGHVSFLSNYTAMTVLGYLSTRARGETVEVP